MNDTPEVSECYHRNAEQTFDGFKGADYIYHYTVACPDCAGVWRNAGWDLEKERLFQVSMLEEQ